jgi:polyhydroxybutyrate depolymerase
MQPSQILAILACAASSLACSAESADPSGQGPGSGAVPAGSDPSSGCGSAPAQAGTFGSTIEAAGLSREYWTVLPADYDGSRPLALIFNWHGAGNSAEQATTWLGVVGESGSEAILVYPQGGVSDTGTWNELETGPDIPLYDALLAHFTASYCVDQNRVFSIGHSAGAFLNAALACSRTETLAAIANDSGFWSVPPRPECAPLGYMFMYGEQDSSIVLTNALQATQYATGCDGEGSPVADPADGGSCIDYSGCEPGSALRWCTHPGGHTWPDAFGRRAVWTFFQKFM